MVRLANLKAHPENYNKHPPSQIAGLVASLQKHGQYKPIVCWGNTIIAGHGVVEAAHFLRWEDIAAVMLPEHLSELEVRAILVADNELAKLSSVDNTQLAMLLEEQQQAGVDLTALGSSNDMLETLLKRVERGIQIEGLLGDTVDRCPACGQLIKKQKVQT